ncbi:Syntaxin [Puccinia graminis f. sp. tritici]|uniref:Syntaxin n=1 Tax=Puccinia graminis f. sp. tritici TaxID=56615 RepID=A0A5B0NJ62_PUCGR|nr:Syntaxin [Puccinia graminis f. sp. tritici]
MARDRLAAMRNANQPNDSEYYEDVYDSYGEPPAAPAYRVQPPAGRRAPPRNGLPNGPGQFNRPSPSGSMDEKPDYDDYYEESQQPSGRHPTGNFEPPMEMKPVSRAPPSNWDSKGPREVSSTEEFFDSIANLQVDLKELSQMISEMSDLSKRSLDASSESDREQLQDELAQLSDDIRRLSAQIKQAIQSFEADHSLLRQRGDPDGNVSVRMDQLAALKKRFIETVQRYAEVEQAARRSMKSRIERQVRIVKPDATPEEVRAAVEDQVNGGGAVFQQALASSNRMGSARNALKEVQSRAEDIKRIEQTISELAQMFNDMATMVEEQDVKVQHIEKQAEVANQDVEAATTELKTAVVSAQGARKKRKCCCIIIAILIIVLGGGGAAFALYKTGVIPGFGTSPSAATATNGTHTASANSTSPYSGTSTGSSTSSTTSKLPSS